MQRMSLDKILEPLGNLYVTTGEDWYFRLSHCLTEPTCPTAVIAPERWQIARYRVDCDSIEDSAQKVVNLVIAEVVDRNVTGSSCPYTNPDDEAFEAWLRRRADGSDEKLPLPPGRHLPESFGLLLDGFLAKTDLSRLLRHGDEHAAHYIVARLRRYLPDTRLDSARAAAFVAERLKSIVPANAAVSAGD